MTDREIEDMIRKAAAHAVPDRLEDILSQCTPQRQTVRTTLPVRPAGFLCIIFDVNPSVSLEVDDDGKAAAVIPLNADAEEILSGLVLLGKPLDEAVAAIVRSMVRHGYLSEISNSILVSVQNADPKKQSELQREVSRVAVDVMIESMGAEEASVISQSFETDAELEELAAAYGISEGKAALIRKLLRSRKQPGAERTGGKRYTFADLAAMSINDIALLAEEEDMNDNTITRTGRPSEGAYIGHRQALERALAYAGLDRSQLYGNSVKLDCRKGLMVYKVKLITPFGRLKYCLDARTGDVVRLKRKNKGKKRYGRKKYYKYNKYMAGRSNYMGKNYNYNYNAYENVPMPEGVIGEEKAKQAALNHAGVTEDQCQYIYCHPEIDNGHVEHYDVKFVANGMKYKYAIGLYDGAVLGRGMKDKGMKTGYVYEGNYHEHMAPPMGADTPSAAPAQSAPEPVCHDGVCELPQQPQAAPSAPATPPPVMQDMTGGMGQDMISEDEALNIALNHAGLSMNDVFRWRVKLLTKHGRMIYRTKLKVMGYEYEIDVDAYSGAITKAHKEVDF